LEVPRIFSALGKNHRVLGLRECAQMIAEVSAQDRRCLEKTRTAAVGSGKARCRHYKRQLLSGVIPAFAG
jgi:hypothetical protein